jgi:hypothetical protein
MRRITKAGFSIAVAALVLVAGWAVTSHGATAGGSPTISVGSATIMVGDTASVNVSALNMAAPGLGAWSLNVVYDPSVLDPQGCTAQNGSVCNPAFASDTIRVSGATAAGLPGDSVLAAIGFRCTQVGSSALTITVDTLADGTPGNPQDIDAAVSNGSVTCVVPTTPTTPPTVEPPPSGGGHGFPAAGGVYVGEVPGTGKVTVVISDDGQGIRVIAVDNLITVCGAITHYIAFDPPLDIEEPGFSLNLGTVSAGSDPEGVAVLLISGTFAENGTIPVRLEIDTSNTDSPASASPCTSANIVFDLVLYRQSAPPPPPTGNTYTPPPSGGTHTGGTYLPNAGSGPALGIDPQSPITWIVAAMIGAGVAWLSAGVAGAGLASVTASTGGDKRQRSVRGFMPSMQPVRRNAQPIVNVDRTAKAARRETLAVERPQMRRSAPKIDGSSIDGFRAPRRPDRG